MSPPSPPEPANEPEDEREDEPRAEPHDGERRVFVAGADAAGQRLDKVLAAHLPEHSRTVVAGWIEAGRVRVDGAPLPGKTRLRGGERLEVSVPPPPPSTLAPEARALDVRFEDDDLLVLAKPSGLTVHPGSGQRDGTLANALVHHLRNLPTLSGSDRPGIVHRLDKDTSGVMLVAKTERAHRGLAKAFAAREVEKTYLAVVHGTVKGERGVVDAPLGRSSAGRTRMALRPDGREAQTGWEVAERLPHHTLLRCFPRTGRTHQIRVHLRSLGHPIVGDALYGYRSSPGERVVGRLLLHAERIAFAHPTTGAPLAFSVAAPDDFVTALLALRSLDAAGPARPRPGQGTRR